MAELSDFLSTNRRQWDAEVWDGLIQTIAAELAPLKEQLNIQKEVTDAIIARGLTVIEQEIAPLVGQADEILENATIELAAKLVRFEAKVVGGTVLTSSSTSATLANAATINLTIPAADREFFAPTPYISLSRASSVANWAIGKVNSFNRLTGSLAVTLEQVAGAGGPYADWIITSLPGASMLQKWYYDQTVTLRQAVADDKSTTTTASATAVSSKDTAVAAKNTAVQAATDVRQAIAVPLVTPTAPVEGQLWYDGAVVRVYDPLLGFTPVVTASLGGIRFERGTFGTSPSGTITVGGGFSSVMVFVNGVLLAETADYTAISPNVQILAPVQGDEYFIWAYKAIDATDYYTKEEANTRFVVSDGGTY